MKTSLVALTLCGVALVAVSGCNKPETAPAPAPAPAASGDAGSQSGQILRPTGAMGAGGGSAPGGGLPAGMSAPPSNAPPNVQQQMQRMNGGFGNR
ncbi:MAG: hypothetical protein ACKO14_12700 [Armatimonadota bacterium]